MKKIILSLILVISIITITGCGNKEKTKIILNDNLEFEINSEIELSSIVKSIENGSIVDEKIEIDSSTLGTKNIKFQYKNDLEQEKEYSLDIKIIDTTKPNIESDNEITTFIGSDINLTEKAVVSDNSNEEIEVKVEGTYDSNQEGTYPLKFIAKDSSGNEAIKEFNLVIKSIKLKSGFYAAENTGKYVAVTIENKRITVAYNTGPGAHGGYDEYGSYKIEGNKLIATMTHYYNLGPDIDATRLSKNKRIEFTIIDNTELKVDNQTLKYKRY